MPSSRSSPLSSDINKRQITAIAAAVEPHEHPAQVLARVAELAFEILGVLLEAYEVGLGTLALGLRLSHPGLLQLELDGQPCDVRFETLALVPQAGEAGLQAG